MCSLEAFENIAYLMAKHADSSIKDKAEEWMEEFSAFSIYQVLPEIITLWGVNLETQSEAKKTACIDWQMTTPLFLLRWCSLGSQSGISTCSRWGSSITCISRATMRTKRRWHGRAISLFLTCSVLFAGTKYLKICLSRHIVKGKDANTWHGGGKDASEFQM